VRASKATSASPSLPPTLSGATQPKAQFVPPLTVCVASHHNFGISCRGAPSPIVEDQSYKCPDDVPFCGYDVDVWRCESALLDVPSHARVAVADQVILCIVAASGRPDSESTLTIEIPSMKTMDDERFYNNVCSAACIAITDSQL
jgi:hypothetical protein